MTTVSTEAITTQIRNRLLNFVPLAGATLQTRLNGRLWKDRAPDTAAFPYGIMRLINNLTDGAYNGDRMTADVEVMLFANTAAQAAALEDAADVCDAAMLRYRDNSSGIVFSRRRQRDTLPPPTDPADREVIQIRLVYPVIVWPVYLTQYAAT